MFRVAGVLAAGSVHPAGLAAAPLPARRSRLTLSDSNAVVETSHGKVRGYTEAGVHTVKGIPYGATTAGQSRFLPPGRPEPWTGVRSSLQYGPACPQVGHACGWILDLRNNDGGNVYPMLAALKPFLGDESLGANMGPDGPTEPRRAGKNVDVEPPSELREVENAWMAVLIGPPLAVAAMADRTGRVYGGRIEPDELIQEIPGAKAQSDATAAAARAWLMGRSGCQ